LTGVSRLGHESVLPCWKYEGTRLPSFLINLDTLCKRDTGQIGRTLYYQIIQRHNHHYIQYSLIEYNYISCYRLISYSLSNTIIILLHHSTNCDYIRYILDNRLVLVECLRNDRYLVVSHRNGYITTPPLVTQALDHRDRVLLHYVGLWPIT